MNSPWPEARWKHDAAIREIVWILMENRGQLRACE